MANIDWGNLLFSFSGRINRGKFWLAVLIYIIISIILTIITAVIGSPTVTNILGFVVNLAVFISGLSVAAKRLHDRNRSAWWLLVFYIVPGLLMGIGMAIALYGALGSGGGSMTTVGSLLSLVGFGVGIWAFVELGCLRGTVGPNQYGPDPLEGRV
ncbi:MAG: DUF805 domain-containing protein [Xanthobacteraceae bacterium]